MPDDNPATTTIELWTRSFAPTVAEPKHERAIDRVKQLERLESVDAVTVGVWGRSFDRTRHRRIPHLERIAATLEAFDAWAERTGRDLEPFFRTRHVESTITGESYDVCRLPTLALAEYRGDELIHVAPSRDGDRTVEVLDRLEVLVREEGEGSTLEFDDRWTDRSPDDPTHRRRSDLDVETERNRR